MDWQALRGPQLTPRGTEGSGGSLLSPTQPLGACRWRGARLSVPLAWFKIRKAGSSPGSRPRSAAGERAGIIHMRQVSTAQRQGPGSRGQRRCRTRLPHTLWPVAGRGTCAGRNCGWGRRVPARGHWEPRPQWRGHRDPALQVWGRNLSPESRALPQIWECSHTAFHHNSCKPLPSSRASDSEGSPGP